MKALAKAADDRYPSANDLRNDLLRFREGKAVSVSAADAAAVAAAPSAEATQVVASTRADATSVATPTTVTTVAGGPPVPPPRRTGLYVALLSVLLVILAILVFLLVDQFSTEGGGGSGAIPVPNVIGKPVAEAAQEITAAGLRAVQEEADNDEFEPGVVFDTNPKADVEVDEDTEVTLFVSAGAPIGRGPERRGSAEGSGPRPCSRPRALPWWSSPRRATNQRARCSRRIRLAAATPGRARPSRSRSPRAQPRSRCPT